MKARRVKGVDPHGTFRANAARIIRTRLDELHQFDPAVRDPARIQDLHSMRIAAKRLRYVLEIAGFAFGAEAQRLEQEAKWLQEVLGEIHDCDVLIPIVEDHVRTLRNEDRDVVLRSDPSTRPRLPNARRYRGLATLVVTLEARRVELYHQFIEHWDRLLASEFRHRVEEALT